MQSYPRHKTKGRNAFLLLRFKILSLIIYKVILLHLFYCNKETYKEQKENVLQSFLVYCQSFLLNIYFDVKIIVWQLEETLLVQLACFTEEQADTEQE